MIHLRFTCYNPLAGSLDSCIDGHDMEFCLEVFSRLVRSGWHPVSVTLSVDAGTATSLPLDAFDGAPMREPLQALQQQWEELLYQH